MDDHEHSREFRHLYEYPIGDIHAHFHGFGYPNNYADEHLLGQFHRHCDEDIHRNPDSKRHSHGYLGV